MTYQECFDHVPAQSLCASQTFNTASGLSIRVKGTSWAGFHQAFEGAAGNELVIGEHCEVEIGFLQEVEQLHVECYVVSDRGLEATQRLIASQAFVDPLPPWPLQHVYWLTLSGSGFTEHLPGPLDNLPRKQCLIGPFRRLTIATSQAGTVHIRKLAWTRTCRH